MDDSSLNDIDKMVFLLFKLGVIDAKMASHVFEKSDNWWPKNEDQDYFDILTWLKRI